MSQRQCVVSSSVDLGLRARPPVSEAVPFKASAARSEKPAFSRTRRTACRLNTLCARSHAAGGLLARVRRRLRRRVARPACVAAGASFFSLVLDFRGSCVSTRAHDAVGQLTAVRGLVALGSSSLRPHRRRGTLEVAALCGNSTVPPPCGLCFAASLCSLVRASCHPNPCSSDAAQELRIASANEAKKGTGCFSK